MDAAARLAPPLLLRHQRRPQTRLLRLLSVYLPFHLTWSTMFQIMLHVQTWQPRGHKRLLPSARPSFPWGWIDWLYFLLLMTSITILYGLDAPAWLHNNNKSNKLKRNGLIAYEFFIGIVNFLELHSLDKHFSNTSLLDKMTKLAWLSHFEFYKRELTMLLITIELDSTTLREFSQTVDGIIVLYQNNWAVSSFIKWNLHFAHIIARTYINSVM
jgi:hypothetical protein